MLLGGAAKRQYREERLAKKSNGKPAFSPSAAEEYVRTLAEGGGGFGEAIRGTCHNTLPSLVGFRELRLSAMFSAGLWLAVTLLSAALPVVVRKVAEAKAASGTGVGSSTVVSTAGAYSTWTFLGIDFDHWDLLLVAVALVLAIAPKVRSWLAVRAESGSRSRALESLASSIRALPAPGPSQAEAVRQSCSEALSGLTREIAHLIGDGAGELTDSVLLVFGDSDLSTMMPLVRTAAGEQVNVKRKAALFQAFYVAKIAQVVAEHRFAGKQSPFPPVRLTPLEANTPVEYQSILFMPVISRVQKPGAPVGTLVDACFGVVCVHSKDPYRFWRFGDHSKVRSSLANKSWVKAAPYVQVIAHCIRVDYPHIIVLDERSDEGATQ